MNKTTRMNRLSCWLPLKGLGDKPPQRSWTLKRLWSQVRKHELVSFDVFDTAILRLVRRPEDVFEYAQAAVREELHDACFPFAEVRIGAERLARKQIVTREKQDITFDEIYSVFARITALNGEQVAQLKNLELCAERKLCYANPIVFAAWLQCRRKRIPVIFASDVYLDRDTLQDLLERNGFAKPVLYVSSELRKSKYVGSLFTHIATELRLRRHRTIHIGDNEHSDYKKATEKRLNAILLHDGIHPRFASKEGDGLFGSLCFGLARRRALSAGRRKQTSSYWETVGYEFAGPICWAYLEWITKRVRKYGVRTLYFLSRDGYLLCEAFKIVREKQGLDIRAWYTFSSRRLFYVACITELNETAFNFLLTPSTFLQTRDFISRTGLCPNSYRRELHQAGLEKTEILTNGNGEFVSEDKRLGLKQLFERLSGDLLTLAERERQILVAYLETIGMSSQRPAVLVDLGWSGSILRSLKMLMEIEGRGYGVVGMFLGTWEAAQTALGDGCEFESYLVHLGRPRSRRDIIHPGASLLEAVFSAPHPTITGLSERDGQFIPRYQEDEPAYDIRARDNIRRGALEFIRDFTEIAPANVSQSAPAYLDALFKRVICNPQPLEARLLGALSHRDGFGVGSKRRQLARIPGRIARRLNGDALRHSLDRCHWRPGFLSQLSSR